MPDDVLEMIGTAALLEQLAEESAELAQAALKMARKLRNENPTPKTHADCVSNLQEEIADAAKALFMVFVVAPMLFMLGVSLVYAVSQFLGSIWNAIILHRFPILRCKKCRYWATVQCPLYGRNTPDDFCSRGERWWDD